MAHQLSASVQGFVGLPARCSSKGQTVAVALRSGAPRRDSTLRPRTLCLSSRAVLRGAALGDAVERCRRPVVARSAVHTTALFKQTTSKVQWSTVVLTAACLAAAVAMLVAVPKPSLALVGAALLGVCALSVAVEFVQDWARRRALQKSGQYEAWQAKATAVADAAKNKRLLSGNEALKASSWTERNVTGAASEEDAHLIRGMNEFLGVAEK